MTMVDVSWQGGTIGSDRNRKNMIFRRSKTEALIKKLEEREAARGSADPDP